MRHNSETEAVDLLLEVDDVAAVLEHVDDKNCARTALYLTSAAAFLPEPDDKAVLTTAFAAYMKARDGQAEGRSVVGHASAGHDCGVRCGAIRSCCGRSGRSHVSACVALSTPPARSQVSRWHDAMRVALRLNEPPRVAQAWNACSDPLDRRQLAHLLARHGTVLDCEEGVCAIADEVEREKVCRGSLRCTQTHARGSGARPAALRCVSAFGL